MSKVFIIDKIRERMDLSGLSKFGKQVQLLSSHRIPSPFDVVGFSNRLILDLKNEDYDYKQDFIALVGRQIQLVVGVAAILCQYGSCKVLMYSSLEDYYVDRVLGETDGSSSKFVQVVEGVSHTNLPIDGRVESGASS